MNIFARLNELGLGADSSVVIGSGILSALNIRNSNDIDVVVTQDVYQNLKRSNCFKIEQNYGQEVLTDELFEIRTAWGVLGKDQDFQDLAKNSAVIDGVRYITLDFLLAVKQSWLKDDNVRQKDVEDVKLIQDYLANQSR